MAKNTGRGSRISTGASKGGNSTGTWANRSASSGRFLKAKSSGGSFSTKGTSK